MAFAYLGEQLRQRFRENLSESALQRALQWNIELSAMPVGEKIPLTCYLERMSISASEPYPASTTQLILGYTICQDHFVSPNEAAQLGTRALTEGKPAPFASKWIETLTLGEQGCFHSGYNLIYTMKFDPMKDFPVVGQSRTGRYDNLSLVKGDMYFEVTDLDDQFASEVKRIKSILSAPDKVLDVFVERWIKGYENTRKLPNSC